MRTIKECSLYLVTSQVYYPERTTVDVVKSAIAGGVDIVQMREKNMSREELLSLGSKLSKICRESGVLFIVNDDPTIASDVDADGVHLGQEDLIEHTIADVRKLLGPDKIIGVSTHSNAQFMKANESDVDYIAYGPVFPTKTKNYFIGADELKGLLKRSLKPVVVIGGIDSGNMRTLLELGANNLAMIRSIVQAENIELKVRELKSVMDEFGVSR